MSLGTSNRDGGKTSESGHLRALGKIVSGDVIAGLNAVQRAAGINMSVDIQVGDAFVRRSDGTYSHPVFNDAVYNQVISAADGSNPRRDIIVIYVDYSETPSTAVSNNTNGVVKIKVVNGTPAGSPVDPNAAAIQASVGSGNPYSILARVRVPAGQTTISNSLIDDFRKMASTLNNGGWDQIQADLTYNAYTSAYKQGVINTSVDLRGSFGVGARVKLWQPTAGWIYGLVHAISSTTMTVYFGTDYALANEAIYLGQYSHKKAPVGFDINEEKWTLVFRKTTRTTQASAALYTWYNLGGSLQIGIGSWLLSAQDLGLQTHSSSTYSGFASSLGTASNGGLIPDTRVKSNVMSLATTEVDDTYQVNRVPFTTAAPATIYLLRGTGTGASVSLYSEQTTDLFAHQNQFIKAISAAL